VLWQDPWVAEVGDGVDDPVQLLPNLQLQQHHKPKLHYNKTPMILINGMWFKLPLLKLLSQQPKQPKL